MSYKGKYISVIIPAAGMGKRMKSEVNKQFILIKDRPVLAHTIEVFNKSNIIDEIIVVSREDEIQLCLETVINKYNFTKVSKVVAGGAERQDSVYNGLLEVRDEDSIVLIHDGARPFIDEEVILETVKGAYQYKTCVVGVPVKDTIKVVDQDGNINKTPDRSTLWAVQTPQVFEYSILRKAYENSRELGYKATDDSMLVEKLGYKVKMIMGSYNNIKITTPEDLKFAEAILEDI